MKFKQNVELDAKLLQAALNHDDMSVMIAVGASEGTLMPSEVLERVKWMQLQPIDYAADVFARLVELENVVTLQQEAALAARMAALARALQ